MIRKLKEVDVQKFPLVYTKIFPFTAPCECTGIGDPHYRTFDGEMIHFMGKCHYTLVTSVKTIYSECPFDINVANEDRRTTGSSSVDVSWTKTVYFKFKGKSVELRKNGIIIVSS